MELLAKQELLELVNNYISQHASSVQENKGLLRSDLLSGDENDNLSNKKNITLYFCGTINQCFALKTLLKETSHNILVYYFNKTKYGLGGDGSGLKSEQEETIKILQNYKIQYRDFEVKEIEFANDEIEDISDFDNLFCHIDFFKEANSQFSNLDAHIITQDLSFFKDKFQTSKLHNRFERQNLNINLLAPFQNFKAQDIAKEALLSYLNYSDLNLSKIYNDNKDIIEAAKSFNGPGNMKEGWLDKFISDQTNYNAIYVYLLSKTSITTSINFVRHYGQFVSKEIHIRLLSTPLAVSFEKEELVMLTVTKGAITNEELNQIILTKVTLLNSKQEEITKVRIDEIDCFFRFFNHGINEETRDQLILISYSKRHFYNKILLEKLIDWKCDIGNLLLKVIDNFAQDVKESRALILLKDYQKNIHPLQINEALLMARQNGLYTLRDELIKSGANEEILQFHSKCYANELFYKTRAKDIKTGRNYLRKKDALIISEILKELGNPHQNIPPVIHVTGSHGKGSTCSFLKSILENNSYKVHMFTSPAAIRGNENYTISGNAITDEAYYGYLKRSEAAFNKIKNSAEFKEKIARANLQDGLCEKEMQEDGYFDWSFIIPAIMLAFNENEADATIIEVITGGELDLTNIFDEKATIATIINTVIFGDSHAHISDFGSIEDAANTKSKLAKINIPIFSSHQESSAARIIQKTANERSCPLMTIGRDFEVQDCDESHFVYKGFGKEWKLQKPRLFGGFQINNAAIALSALLHNKDKFNLDQNKTSKAIKSAYLISRFGEIKNDLIKGYEKLYFGTIKSKFGEPILDSFDKSKCSVIKKYKNHLDEYTGNMENNLKGYHKVILLDVEQKDRWCFDQKLSAINLEHKKYLSSAIAYLDGLEKSKYLLIPIVRMMSFPGYYALVLGQVKQANFQEDLKFALKHKLIDEA